MKLPSIRKLRPRWRPRPSLAGVILLSIGLGGCSGQPHRPSLKLGTDTLNVARTALAGGNPKLALNIANAVLKTDPGNVHARLTRGDAFYLLGNCLGASAAYRATLRQQPQNTEAELGLGRCALQHDPRSASVSFERAVHDDPKNAIALNDLGISQAEQSQFRRASTSFRKALSLDPSLRAAEINLGMSLALGGRPVQAEMILGPLAQSSDTTPKIRADYATALALSGDIKGSANELHGDMPDAEARSMVARLVRLTPPPAATAEKPD